MVNQPEEVGTRSNEGDKEGNSTTSSFEVVFEASLLLLLLLRAPGIFNIDFRFLKTDLTQAWASISCTSPSVGSPVGEIL